MRRPDARHRRQPSLERSCGSRRTASASSPTRPAGSRRSTGTTSRAAFDRDRPGQQHLLRARVLPDQRPARRAVPEDRRAGHAARAAPSAPARDTWRRAAGAARSSRRERRASAPRRDEALGSPLPVTGMPMRCPRRRSRARRRTRRSRSRSSWAPAGSRSSRRTATLQRSARSGIHGHRRVGQGLSRRSPHGHHGHEAAELRAREGARVPRPHADGRCRPGRYQMRVAAAENRASGSALYDLEVPDFQKAPVTMSGIAVTSTLRGAGADGGAEGRVRRRCCRRRGPRCASSRAARTSRCSPSSTRTLRRRRRTCSTLPPPCGMRPGASVFEDHDERVIVGAPGRTGRVRLLRASLDRAVPARRLRDSRRGTFPARRRTGRRRPRRPDSSPMSDAAAAVSGPRRRGPVEEPLTASADSVRLDRAVQVLELVLVLVHLRVDRAMRASPRSLRPAAAACDSGSVAGHRVAALVVPELV